MIEDDDSIKYMMDKRRCGKYACRWRRRWRESVMSISNCSLEQLEFDELDGSIERYNLQWSRMTII